MLSIDEIRAMPKVELHRHLEGSIRPTTLLELARENDIELPAENIGELMPYVSHTDDDMSLLDYLLKFDVVMKPIKKPEDLERITWEAVEDAVNDNIIYLELRFSPEFIKEKTQIPVSSAARTITRSSAEASKFFTVPVTITLISTREIGLESSLRTIKEATSLSIYGVTGFDIAGDEVHFPVGIFKQAIIDARASGLGVTVHAGEAGSGREVELALGYGAQRIGHGVNAANDKTVLEAIKEHDALIEVCLTTNLHVGAIKSYVEHPARKFFDSGIKIAFCADDPQMSCITLSNELWFAAKYLDFTRDEILLTQLMGVDKAFVGANAKRHLRRMLGKGFKNN
ncbi:MAG: adenosine deaminase [Actinobacteria bacterium]|nr:adenosine deaminase [Actinomycetota bacterium]